MTREPEAGASVADDRTSFERSTEEFQLALEQGLPDRYVMRLYIAGNSIRSRAAIEGIRRVCDRYLCGRCDLEVVVDLYQDATRGHADTIVAAPTLVKYSPCRAAGSSAI